MAKFKNDYDYNTAKLGLAYMNGLLPASKIKGVPAVLIKKYCSPREIHRTSKFFNQTDFYNPTEVRATFGLEPLFAALENREAVDALHNWNRLKTKSITKIYERCIVEWVEYRDKSHYPRAISHRIKDARIEVRGNIATVFKKDGKIMKKRISGKGFKFFPTTPAAEQISLFD